MSEHPQRNVLIIEDEVHIRKILRVHLENAGYVVAEAESAEAAERFATGAGLILLDLVLTGKSGGAFLREIRSQGVSVPVIVITGYDDVELRKDADTLGILFWLPKPVRREELLDKVRRAFSATCVFEKIGGFSRRLDCVLGKLADVNGESYIPRTL